MQVSITHLFAEEPTDEQQQQLRRLAAMLEEATVGKIRIEHGSLTDPSGEQDITDEFGELEVLAVVDLTSTSSVKVRAKASWASGDYPVGVARLTVIDGIDTFANSLPNERPGETPDQKRVRAAAELIARRSISQIVTTVKQVITAAPAAI